MTSWQAPRRRQSQIDLAAGGGKEGPDALVRMLDGLLPSPTPPVRTPVLIATSFPLRKGA